MKTAINVIKKFPRAQLVNLLLFIALIIAIAGCSGSSSSRTCPTCPSLTDLAVTANYWRPISAPNLMMPALEAQGKLEFDLSQCQCANFPKNIATPVMMQYQPDQQRMVQTSRGGSCGTATAGVLSECMRARGWEPTICSGRLPPEDGGPAYCPLK
jgi:hypothetical protein